MCHPLPSCMQPPAACCALRLPQPPPPCLHFHRAAPASLLNSIFQDISYHHDWVPPAHNPPAFSRLSCPACTAPPPSRAAAYSTLLPQASSVSRVCRSVILANPSCKADRRPVLGCIPSCHRRTRRQCLPACALIHASALLTPFLLTLFKATPFPHYGYSHPLHSFYLLPCNPSHLYSTRLLSPLAPSSQRAPWPDCAAVLAPSASWLLCRPIINEQQIQVAELLGKGAGRTQVASLEAGGPKRLWEKRGNRH